MVGNETSCKSLRRSLGWVCFCWCSDRCVICVDFSRDRGCEGVIVSSHLLLAHTGAPCFDHRCHGTLCVFFRRGDRCRFDRCLFSLHLFFSLSSEASEFVMTHRGQGNAQPLHRRCAALDTVLVEEDGCFGNVLGVKSVSQSHFAPAQCYGYGVVCVCVLTVFQKQVEKSRESEDAPPAVWHPRKRSTTFPTECSTQGAIGEHRECKPSERKQWRCLSSPCDRCTERSFWIRVLCSSPESQEFLSAG